MPRSQKIFTSLVISPHTFYRAINLISASMLFIGLNTSCSLNTQPTSKDETALTPLTPVKTKPNVLWIITDDQRADSIAAFNQNQRGESSSPLGYVESPNIDNFAKEGVMFTHAYNNSPACAPSRASMIMGLYPHHSGRYGFEKTHDQHDLMTKPIPVELRDQGYQTALFGKLGFRIYQYKDNKVTWESLGFYDTVVDMKNDLSHNNLTDFVKFEHYDKNWKNIGKTERFIFPNNRAVNLPVNKDFDRHTSDIDHELHILRAYTRDQETLILGGVSSQPAGDTLDGHILKSFKRFLQNQNTDYKTSFNKTYNGPNTTKPLMVNLGFHFPHTPVLPPKEYRDRFKNKAYTVPTFSKDELTKLPKQLVRLYKKMKTDSLTPKEKQQAIADYYAFCAYGDHLVGQAIKEFKQYSAKNNQEYIIVLTVGDHGWQLGEQGIEAKFSPWNTSNQGVLIVADSQAKRFPKGKIVNDFVEYVDIAPTILSAVGINTEETAAHLSGYDLAKIIRKQAPQREYVLGEFNHVVGPHAFMRSQDFAFSMRTRKQNTKPGNGFQPGENIEWARHASNEDVEMALYDLRCDKDERNNVAYDKRYKDITRYFRKKLSDIILGDGRVEVDWSKPNSYFVSRFAEGADDKRLNGLEVKLSCM